MLLICFLTWLYFKYFKKSKVTALWVNHEELWAKRAAIADIIIIISVIIYLMV